MVGGEAHCTDGVCGQVSRVVLDPVTRAVTHLVIDPRHRRARGRLVPIELIDTTRGDVRVRCTLAEFGNLDPAEAPRFVEGVSHDGLGPLGMDSPMGIPHPVETTVEDVIPLGETELRRGEPVHAVDGEIGHIQGFALDPGDHRVTHVLLKEGHPWGRKEVAIPVSAISSVRDGITLSITKDQVAALPPLGHQPASG
jgi:sporulation protein YlmC with PRC-barrel domain